MININIVEEFQFDEKLVILDGNKKHARREDNLWSEIRIDFLKTLKNSKCSLKDFSKFSNNICHLLCNAGYSEVENDPKIQGIYGKQKRDRLWSEHF